MIAKINVLASNLMVRTSFLLYSANKKSAIVNLCS